MSPILLLATDPLFGLPFARASYLVIFGALFGYLALLHRSHRRLSGRMAELERRLDSDASPD